MPEILLAGLAERGSETAQRLECCFFTTLPPLRGPPPLTQGRLIQPSPVEEGGGRRLTDEVYFAK